MQAQSMYEMMIKHETPYDVILCHLKDGSFLVLQCSEQVDVASDEWYVIFYHTVDFSSEQMGIFFTRLTRSIKRVNLAVRMA